MLVCMMAGIFLGKKAQFVYDSRNDNNELGENWGGVVKTPCTLIAGSILVLYYIVRI